jgi:hypothetical protein
MRSVALLRVLPIARSSVPKMTGKVARFVLAPRCTSRTQPLQPPSSGQPGEKRAGLALFLVAAFSPACLLAMRAHTTATAKRVLELARSHAGPAAYRVWRDVVCDSSFQESRGRSDTVRWPSIGGCLRVCSLAAAFAAGRPIHSRRVMSIAHTRRVSHRSTVAHTHTRCPIPPATRPRPWRPM